MPYHPRMSDQTLNQTWTANKRALNVSLNYASTVCLLGKFNLPMMLEAMFKVDDADVDIVVSCDW